MSKRFLACFLAALLCMTCSLALADETEPNAPPPSIDAGSVVIIDLAPVTVAPMELECQELLDAITKIVEEGNPTVTAFDADVLEQIKSALPEGAAPEALVMDEFFQLIKVEDAELNPEDGSISVTFGTAATYAPDDVIIALLGKIVDGVTTWSTLPCTIVDGRVCVSFTVEEIEALNDGKSVVTFLRLPKE